MAESVYKVIELIGTSTESWEAAGPFILWLTEWITVFFDTVVPATRACPHAHSRVFWRVLGSGVSGLPARC